MNANSRSFRLAARSRALMAALVTLAAACSAKVDPNTQGAAAAGASYSAGTPASAGSAGHAGAGTHALAGALGTAGTPGGTAGGTTAGRAGTGAGAAAASGIGASGTGAVAGASGAAVGGATAAGSSAPSASDPVTFSKNVRLNDDTGSARQTEVALAAGRDGLVLAGWMDERANRICAFSFSTDGGATWSKNVSIPQDGGVFVGDPAVAIDGGGTMYAVCQNYLNSQGSAGNIRMMTSSDRGTTWSEIRTVQSAPDKPWVHGGTSDGVVFLSWLGNPGGIKRSLDHGLTWGPVQSLGNIIHGTGISSSTTGLLHVPYNLDSNRNQLRYLRSKDNGATYETPRDLLPNMGTFCFSCTPRQHPIVGSSSDATGKYVAITWASRMSGGESDDDVWVLYSKDGGE
ncbi:MAG: repeat-like domain, partial [Pseudomonadota bacterium]